MPESTYTPEAGDIVWVDFDPSAGKEINKRRPALVLSPGGINRSLKRAVVVPISNGAHTFDNTLAVPLPATLQTEGRCLTWSFMNLDWEARDIEFIEKAPGSLVRDVRSVVNVFTGNEG